MMDDGDDSEDQDSFGLSSPSQSQDPQPRKKAAFRSLSIEVNSSLLHRSTENFWVGVKGPVVMHEKLSGAGAGAEKGSPQYAKFLKLSGLASMNYLPEKFDEAYKEFVSLEESKPRKETASTGFHTIQGKNVFRMCWGLPGVVELDANLKVINQVPHFVMTGKVRFLVINLRDC